jgi:hypothetical protein
MVRENWDLNNATGESSFEIKSRYKVENGAL